eukprot:TRINITY_DN9177_c0_g1_i1.p1 TRINITY_DN9177_c0_g1~~TRINITY_DN9177_c0_g1_i1.p1  ORF type:complete len:480 (+),score=141.81 TRINITY_DN9177_c0_g1_i1:32-1471(+)
MALDSTKTLANISEWWNAKNGVVEKITEYISIPNQSPDYDPEWETNGLLDQAVTLLVDWVKAQNVENLELEIVKEPGRTPVIFMTVPAKNVTSTDSVLLYGHLDKQPPLTEAWSEGLHPYKPVIRDGKLYGRGGADDGYATFSAITAIKNLQVQGASYPRLVILIEACEESGSPDLEYYVDKLTPRIGNIGLIVCLDSGCGDYTHFWMTTSLRGIASGTLTVKILEQAMHSGSASGVVPSSFRIARNLLDRLEDSKTGKILLEDLYVEIPGPRIEQAKQAAEFLGNTVYSEFPMVSGAQPVTTDISELILNRTWRPQLSTTGASGMPPAETAGNVLRTHTTLKLSTRLPPTKDAAQALKAIKELLEKDPPYGAHVEFANEHPAAGWASPISAPWLDKAIDTAANAFYKAPAAQIGEGGSIPFMGMLGKKFPAAQFVITGVLGPGSNAHGPDEFLHIETGIKVTSCVSHILSDFATHLSA